MTAYFIDTETTGISKQDQVIELAWYNSHSLKDEKIENPIENCIVNKRYRPSVEINPRAQEVHGISIRDLSTCPSANTVNLPSKIDYLIGHNVSFDKRMLEQTNGGLKPQLDKVKYICTLALAKNISKFLKIEYENHKLDTLLRHYHPVISDNLLTGFHSANGDVVKTVMVFISLVNHLSTLETYEDVWKFQKNMASKK